MAGFDLPSVGGLETLEDVKTYLHRLERNMKYLMGGNLGSSNIREVGGWELGEFTLTSPNGNVGLNSEITDFTDVRIWAGGLPETAPFRVTDDGSVVANKLTASGSITLGPGSSIQWGVVNAPTPAQVGARPDDWLPTPFQIGAEPTTSPRFTWIGPTGIYTGTLNAEQINVGTLTGFIIQTHTPFSNRRIVLDPLGLRAFDNNGVKRISIENDGTWNNEQFIFSSTAGLMVGVLGSFGNAVSLAAASGVNPTAKLLLSSQAGIEFVSGSPIDFRHNVVTGLDIVAKFG